MSIGVYNNKQRMRNCESEANMLAKKKAPFAVYFCLAREKMGCKRAFIAISLFILSREIEGGLFGSDGKLSVSFYKLWEALCTVF